MRMRFLADDFTGASDVLLQCRKNGAEAAIVEDLLQERAATKLTGIASAARSMSEQELSAYLPGVLEHFKSSGTDVFLYKVCSTFDSSPQIGSIGHAISLIQQSLGSNVPVTVVPAQPSFGRYTAFGNHFAVFGEQVHRLDRHPIMRDHPTTPMGDADLRNVLEDQGVQRDRMVHVSITELRQDGTRLAQLLRNGEQFDVIVVDAMDDSDLDLVAQEIAVLQKESQQTVPVVGSGGIAGTLARFSSGQEIPPTQQFEQGVTLALSGSRSALTERQIATAISAGWKEVALEQHSVVARTPDVDARVEQVMTALESGRSVVAAIASGTSTDEAADPSKLAKASGELFAEVIRASLKRVPTCRIAVLGGDTASWTVSTLRPKEIRVAAEFVQAGPILNLEAHEIPATTPFLLKGGQVGDPNTLLKFAAI